MASDAGDRGIVSWKGKHRLGCIHHVPDLDRGVLAPCEDLRAVGGPLAGRYEALMSDEFDERLCDDLGLGKERTMRRGLFVVFSVQ